MRVVLNVKAVFDGMIEAQVTKKELAERIGVARGTLDSYLNNPENVPLRAISDMAEALDIRCTTTLIREEEYETNCGM